MWVGFCLTSVPPILDATSLGRFPQAGRHGQAMGVSMRLCTFQVRVLDCTLALGVFPCLTCIMQCPTGQTVVSSSQGALKRNIRSDCICGGNALTALARVAGLYLQRPEPKGLQWLGNYGRLPFAEALETETQQIAATVKRP